MYYRILIQAERARFDAWGMNGARDIIVRRLPGTSTLVRIVSEVMEIVATVQQPNWTDRKPDWVRVSTEGEDTGGTGFNVCINWPVQLDQLAEQLAIFEVGRLEEEMSGHVPGDAWKGWQPGQRGDAIVPR